MENAGQHGPGPGNVTIGPTGRNEMENRQSLKRPPPQPPMIEFDPDPVELKRLSRSMSRKLSVKQLARLSLQHSLSIRGRSRSRRAQSDITRPSVQEQQMPSTPPQAQAQDRPQDQRRSKIPEVPPPHLKFTPLELHRGGPYKTHKLSIIREAKAAEEDRRKRANEIAVRRSMKAPNIPLP